MRTDHRSSKLKTTIQLFPNDEDHTEVLVYYCEHAACRGSRDRYGVQEEPDEEAHLEIEDVTLLDGTQVFLENDDYIELEQQIEEELDGRDDPMSYDLDDYGD